MNFENFTTKAAEAVQSAQQLALKLQHQQIDVWHLLLALVEQKDGYIPMIFKKSGVQSQMIIQGILTKLQQFPKISGQYQLSMSQIFQSVLQESQLIVTSLNDQYVTTEHILLALFKLKTDPIQTLLIPQGMSYESVMKVIQQIRGGETVTSQDPEVNLEILEKFGRDLTKVAQE